MKKSIFFFIHQLNQMDCGPACLVMIAKYYGRNLDVNEVRTKTQLNKEGVNFLGIANTAEEIGLRTLSGDHKTQIDSYKIAPNFTGDLIDIHDYYETNMKLIFKSYKAKKGQIKVAYYY